METSPLPIVEGTAEVKEIQYPRCNHCHLEVKKINYIDFGPIRVVCHAETGIPGKSFGNCVLGVINAE